MGIHEWKNFCCWDCSFEGRSHPAARRQINSPAASFLFPLKSFLLTFYFHFIVLHPLWTKILCLHKTCTDLAIGRFKVDGTLNVSFVLVSFPKIFYHFSSAKKHTERHDWKNTRRLSNVQSEVEAKNNLELKASIVVFTLTPFTNIKYNHQWNKTSVLTVDQDQGRAVFLHGNSRPVCAVVGRCKGGDCGPSTISVSKVLASPCSTASPSLSLSAYDWALMQSRECWRVETESESTTMKRCNKPREQKQMISTALSFTSWQTKETLQQ